MRKRLLAAITALGLIIAAIPAAPIAAAAKPSKVKITGPSTVKVGKEIDLDAKFTPKKARVADRKIIWKSSNSKIAKVMDNHDDDTEIKGIKAGKAKITVKIKGTKLKATKKITVKKKSTAKKASTSTDLQKIAGYKTTATSIKKSIAGLSVPASEASQLTLYRTWEKKIENLEDKLDKIEDKWEDKYNSGKITRATYRQIENKIDEVENILEQAEDLLEDKFPEIDD